MRFLRTAQLIHDSGLRTLVDQLARSSCIESAHVGEGGEPSAVHATFCRLAEKVSRQEAVALLRHDSPVVRGYLAGHVLEAFPEELEAIYPLLADETAVEVLDGCEGGRCGVGKVVLEALEDHLERPEVVELLLRAARDASLGELRVRALLLIAGRRPAEATVVALGLLGEKRPKVLAGAIRTLGLAGAQSCAAVVCGYAGSTDSEVRAAVALALGALQGPGVPETRLRLTADSDPYVRMLAGSDYVKSPGRDGAVVRRLLADPAPRVRNYVATALGKLGGEEDVALLRDYLALHPGGWEPVGALARHRKPSVLALMRELLAEPRHSSLHAQAIRYLHEAGDRDSVHLIAPALQSASIHDRMAAAAALADLGGQSAVPSLVALLADDNAHGRLAAARSLARLGTPEVRAALGRAAAGETSWAREEMTTLAQSAARTRPHAEDAARGGE